MPKPPLPIWELPYKEKLAIAKQFGVKDPGKLSKKQLDEKLLKDIHPIYCCYE